MTREEVAEWLNTGKDKTERHTPLVKMCCVFEGDDGSYTEVEFAVPIDWLVSYKVDETHDIWSWEDVRLWLENDYTSDDSQQILEKAIEENQLAFWRIN